ncbi:MAG: carbamoyltransferase HypF [Acidobacteriota bacterium]
MTGVRLRLRVSIRGAVQGVGFRPFLYRLATSMQLSGWVVNSAQGVCIEVEGDEERLRRFLLRIEAEKPPRSSIYSLESSFLDAVGYGSFEVRLSQDTGAKTATVLPDIATCPDCLREVFDPANRRYRYPFTNCTNCGPRFTIIEKLPYDRHNTTMKGFEMCARCRAEYDDPLDRRFHAQPNACPACGPHLELWDPAGVALASHDAALRRAAAAVRSGAIVAVKGLGGFHLMADARSEDSVRELRRRKAREEKPFALMLPSLDSIKDVCEVSELEARLLQSPESPIVLLRRRPGSIAPSVAPANPYLGVMLPYTPLHHLLMAEIGFPVIATSGNRSDEPICTDERDALERLAGIADLFLVHNRPIARHVDDSIVRMMLDREMVLRRARGYAPLPIHLQRAPSCTLAVGAHLKNTVALSVDRDVFVSQHIGDLETEQALEAFRRVIHDLEQLYEVEPVRIACDLHPDYLSTRFAEGLPSKPVHVQHHAAHVMACMAENEIEGPVLGVSWDGTGYGLDATIWGGEFFSGASIERVAHFRRFRLPGGEAAIREPRRSALGLLYELVGDAVVDRPDLASAFGAKELEVLCTMLRKGLNSPVTSSAGRLFDAVAALTGLRKVTRFEGQAAMELEFALDGVDMNEAYPFTIQSAGGMPMVVDWGPAITSLLDDVGSGESTGVVAARFHNTLVRVIVEVAARVGEERVVLSGGCFQNKYLTERAVKQLRRSGFRPYWHQRIPPNDGGIALGQVVAAAISR